MKPDRSSRPPRNEIPVGTDVGAVLGRTDLSALFVHSFQVFSTGCAFRLTLLLAPELRANLAVDLVDFRGHASVPDEPYVLAVDVDCPDGRRLSNAADRAGGGGELDLVGSGGSAGWWEARFWIPDPLPVPHVTLAVRWPAGDVNVQATVATEPLRAARAAVVTLPW